MSGLSKNMRLLVEKHTNFTIPEDVGDPNLSVGTVIDVSSSSRPTIGRLDSGFFGNVNLGTIGETGLLDVDLSLSKLVTVSAGLSGNISPEAQVEVKLKLKHSRDVALVLTPDKGQKLNGGLLHIAAAIAHHPKWNHKKYAFVYRTFAVKSAEMRMARKGNGEITLRGKAKAVSKVINGELDASVTWDVSNVILESITAPGVLGVHCVQVSKNGTLKYV